MNQLQNKKPQYETILITGGAGFSINSELPEQLDHDLFFLKGLHNCIYGH